MSKTINIRVIISHFQPIYTGAGKSLEKLMEALKTNGYNYKFEIITAYKKGLPKTENKGNFKIIRLGHGFFNKNGYLNNLGKLDFALSAAWYNLINKNYDILKLIGAGKTNLTSIIINKFYKKPLVNKITGVGDDDPKKLNNTILGKFIIKLLKKNTAHWIISKEIYDLAILYTNWNNDSLFLITNPVNVLCKDYKKLENKKKELKKNEEKMKFLFVGVLDKRKGVDILLEVWDKLNRDATLILCGPLGKDMDLNENLNKNLNKNIKILGELSREELKTQYLSADYFIFPSKREGLPNVLLESMSFGLPIIANNITGVTDFLLGNNERGININNNKVEEWINVISKIIEEKNYNKKMSKKAYEWVVKNSSYEAVGNQINNMYLKLLNNEID